MESFRSQGIGPQAAILRGATSLDNYTDEELKQVPTAQLVKYVTLNRFRTISRDDLHNHATVQELAEAGFRCDDLIGKYKFCDLYPHFPVAALRCHFTPQRIFDLIDTILSNGGFDVIEEKVSLRELRSLGFTAREIKESRYYECADTSCFAEAFTVKEMIDSGEHSEILSHYTLLHCKQHLSLEGLIAHSIFTINMDLSPFYVNELNNLFGRLDVMKQLVKKLRLDGEDVAECLQRHYEPQEFFTEVSPCEMMQVSEKGDDFDFRLRQEWFPQLRNYPPATRAWVETHVQTEHRVYNILHAGLLGSLLDAMKTDKELCRSVCSSKLTDMFSPVEIVAYFGSLASDDEHRSYDLPLELFLSKMPAACVRVHGANKLIVSGLHPKSVRAACTSSQPLFLSQAAQLICEANEGDWLKSAGYSVETLHSMGCKFEHVLELYGISYCGIYGVAEYKRANVGLPILLKVFTMQELIEGWGDRVDLARHCHMNCTLIDLANFFSVEELVAAEYEMDEILQCSFELSEVSKSFSAKELCYKHLRGIPHAIYLNVSSLKGVYGLEELSLCFPLVELMQNFDLAELIYGIKFGAYNAMNIDTTGRALGLDWTIRDLRWNGLTLDHIPKEHLHYWNLCRLHPTFCMDDLLAHYGMVEIAKAFSPRELAKHFSLPDFVWHFPCCELMEHFDLGPDKRTTLLACLKRDLVDERKVTSIREYILRDEVPIDELTQFVRHAKDFDRAGLHLGDLRRMGLSCKGAVHLGYKNVRGGGYTCEDIRDCGLDHVFAAHAGFSLLEIQDAMNLTNVDRGEVEEILTWGYVDNDFV